MLPLYNSAVRTTRRQAADRGREEGREGRYWGGRPRAELQRRRCLNGVFVIAERALLSPLRPVERASSVAHQSGIDGGREKEGDIFSGGGSAPRRPFNAAIISPPPTTGATG
ncbi:hypothetical protein MRX96_019184 [Rhipicephalus microplus]